MAKGIFCYLVSITAVVWSRNRNMIFIITIWAIMTVREMSWLTCQDFKKRVHLCQSSSFDSGKKVRFWRYQLLASVDIYYQKNDVYWLKMCILLLLVIIVHSWEIKILVHDDFERSERSNFLERVVTHEICAEGWKTAYQSHDCVVCVVPSDHLRNQDPEGLGDPGFKEHHEKSTKEQNIPPWRRRLSFVGRGRHFYKYFSEDVSH